MNNSFVWKDVAVEVAVADRKVPIKELTIYDGNHK